MKSQKIVRISNFLEDAEREIYGFTVTYKNGKIKNYFVSGNLEDNEYQIEKLKTKYQNLIKNKKSR
jgi:hypothetical protein